LAKKIKYRFLYKAFRIFAFLAGLAPFSAAAALGKGLGRLAYYLQPARRKTALENIRQCPALPVGINRVKLAKDSFAHLGLAGTEFVKFYNFSREEVFSRIEITGKEYLSAALKEGKGAIVISSHLGNWELMIMALAMAGYPLRPLAKKQRNRLFDRLVNEKRRSTGMKPLPVGFTLREIIRALNHNEVVIFLMDQHAGRGGVRTEFLGREASVHRGPALVALKTGVPVLPVHITRTTPRRHRIKILPPVEIIKTGNKQEDIRENTERFCEIIGQKILEAPEQWLWMHRRWRPVKKKGAKSPVPTQYRLKRLPVHQGDNDSSGRYEKKLPERPREKGERSPGETSAQP